jgi:hypothetical protein
MGLNKDGHPPKFYCKTWIKEQGYMPRYKTEECKEQCDSCINAVLDYHSKKKSDKS